MELLYCVSTMLKIFKNIRTVVNSQFGRHVSFDECLQVSQTQYKYFLKPLGGTMRLQGLDFLRITAVILVIFSHLGYQGARGFGVPLLIVLSAFLITRIFMNAPTTYTFKKHLLRRFYRIAPAYLCFILLTISADYFLGDKWTVVEIMHALTHTVNYWNAMHGHTSTISHVWTLSILEQFFIVSFFVLPLLFSLSVRSFLVTSAIILLTFTTYRTVAYSIFNAPERFIYNDFFSRIDQYMVGVLLGYWYEKKRTFPSITVLQSILFLTTCLFLIKYIRHWTELYYSLGFLVEGICAAIIIISFTTLASSVNILNSKAVILLASASYSAYLWHGWATTISVKYLGDELLVAATALAISFTAGLGSYFLLEKYFLRIKQNVLSH